MLNAFSKLILFKGFRFTQQGHSVIGCIYLILRRNLKGSWIFHSLYESNCHSASRNLNYLCYWINSHPGLHHNESSESRHCRSYERLPFLVLHSPRMWSSPLCNSRCILIPAVFHTVDRKDSSWESSENIVIPPNPKIESEAAAREANHAKRGFEQLVEGA